MSKVFGGNVHVGLTGLDIEKETIDLGEGISLKGTYAHLMAPFIVAFKPAEAGKPHPAPWKPARGGFTFDINAELMVPANIENKFNDKTEVVRIIIFLLRLGCNPAILAPVFSNYSFEIIPEMDDNSTILIPFETNHRHFPLGVSGSQLCPESIKWVKDNWGVTYRLVAESPEFSLAVEALNSGQFVQNTTLTMVSLWGALEALFSPANSELKFRVSSLIASYIEEPGVKRLEAQKSIAKLYDKRSSAAHGKPKHGGDDLLATFNLLGKVLCKIINEKEVPSKEKLEQGLFGV